MKRFGTRQKRSEARLNRIAAYLIPALAFGAGIFSLCEGFSQIEHGDDVAGGLLALSSALTLILASIMLFEAFSEDREQKG